MRAHNKYLVFKGKMMVIPENSSIVIFGASGDLTYRKLIPALYHLYANKQ
ncbi:hypothetical protein, partial [Vibrio campbellii]